MKWFTTKKVDSDGKGGFSYSEVRFPWDQVGPCVWVHPEHKEWTVIPTAAGFMTITENVDFVCDEIDKAKEEALAAYDKKYLERQVPQLMLSSKMLQTIKEHMGE